MISGWDYGVDRNATINGGILELRVDIKAFRDVPTIGSGMKLSVSDGNGGYTPVSFAERTSQLSTAKDLKLEPCTSHSYGEATEYIDSSYHGNRCQYCGIGNEGKTAHDFGTDGFCTCGAVQFLDENGEAHYEIPAPYMVDAIGVYSDQVSFTLSEDARGYVLTVEADKEWINAEDREFPVNIDPTLAVISGQALQDIYSVYTMEAAPNDTTLGRQWLYVGGTALQHLQ